MWLPRLRSLESLVWGMMMFVIVCMLYTLNELHTHYQQHPYAMMDPAQHGRQIRAIAPITDSTNSTLYEAGQGDDNHPEILDESDIRLRPDIHAAEEKPSDHHAKMLEEIDGFNYFVEWESPSVQIEQKDKNHGENAPHGKRNNPKSAGQINANLHDAFNNQNSKQQNKVDKLYEQNFVNSKSVKKPPVINGNTNYFDTEKRNVKINPAVEYIRQQRENAKADILHQNAAPQFNMNQNQQAQVNPGFVNNIKKNVPGQRTNENPKYVQPQVPARDILASNNQGPLSNNDPNKMVGNNQVLSNNAHSRHNRASGNQGQQLPLNDATAYLTGTGVDIGKNGQMDMNNAQAPRSNNPQVPPNVALINPLPLDTDHVPPDVEIIKPLPLNQSSWSLQQIQSQQSVASNKNSSGSLHAANKYSDDMNGVVVSLNQPTPIPAVIHKVYVEPIGRLGNNMFQFASVYGIARTSRRIPALPHVDNQLLDVFHPDIMKYASFEPLPENLTVLQEESSGIYTPKLTYMPPRDIAVCCYLQSWKYFRDYKKELKTIFRFKDWIAIRASRLLQTVTRNYLTSANKVRYGQHKLTYIGVHVRRSDYMMSTHLARGYKPATITYLHKAMDYFRQKYPNVYFIVCSDEIEWCKQHISQSDVYFADGEQGSTLDLALLTQCNHTVITVGSFGWWAGWLAGGDVVYYRDWPRPGTEIGNSYKHEDYFPPHWKGIGD